MGGHCSELGKDPARLACEDSFLHPFVDKMLLSSGHREGTWHYEGFMACSREEDEGKVRSNPFLLLFSQTFKLKRFSIPWCFLFCGSEVHQILGLIV